MTMIARGSSPWVELLFHDDPAIRAHAQWALGMEWKYQRGWEWWRLWSLPEPPMTLEFVADEPPRGLDRALGWMLALYALWRALR